MSVRRNLIYDLLRDFAQRPAPHSQTTVKELWTRPHLARRMLRLHLDQDTDLASRPLKSIDRIVDWLDRQLALCGKSLCDLGCGPGLYTARFANRGAAVTGIDISRHSLDYAIGQAADTRPPIRYLEADYLADPLPAGFDVVTLIYYDYCALSPERRKRVLARIHDMLNPAGKLVLDVLGLAAFADRREQTILEQNLMHGFWAPGDYVGIQRTFLYPDLALALDRTLIIEPAQTWQNFNWLQYYTPRSLSAELNEAGFRIGSMTGSLAGDPLTDNSPSIGVIAVKREIETCGK